MQTQPEKTTNDDPAPQAAQPAQKSWGDRFKKPVTGIATYFGLNGVFNLFFSAAIAYACERSFEPRLKSAVQNLGAKVAAKTGWSEKRLSNIFYMVPKTLLLSGGTFLLPAIKWIEDNRNRLEFKLGHTLDKLQEFFGKGNNASKQNIEDYKNITQAQRTNNPLPLTPEDAARLHSKYHLDGVENDRLAFKEHRLPWLKIISARAGALFTTDVIVAGVLGYLGLPKKFEQWGPAVTRGMTKIFPWYSKIIKEPDIFSKNLTMDVVLTASIAVTHKVVQDILHHNPKAQSKETADMKHSIRIRKSAPATSDFRSREQGKPAEAALAV